MAAPARGQSGHVVASWPLGALTHKSLLGSVAQDVPQPADLDALVVLDRSRMVAVLPQGVFPVVEMADLDGELLFDAEHKPGQVVGVPRRHQEVEVVRGEGEAVDRHRKLPLDAAQDAAHDPAQLARGKQQVALLEGPVGDLAHVAWRDVMKRRWARSIASATPISSARRRPLAMHSPPRSSRGSRSLAWPPLGWSRTTW